jgi:Fe-S cluster assembly protein SufD
MSVEPRNLRTRAEEQIAAEYHARRTRLPGGPAALARRDAAYAAFAAAGLPHRRVEAWKYTDLRALLRAFPPLAGDAPAGLVAEIAASDLIGGLDRARIVVVNGVYRPDFSDLRGAEALKVESVGDILAGEPGRLGALFVDEDDAMLALNAALVQGGVAVSVPAGTGLKAPLEIVHITASTEPVSVAPRTVLDIGPQAGLKVIETFLGGPPAYQVNAVTELTIGDGANVSWSRLQGEGREATHIGSLVARIGRDVSLDHLVVNAGATLSRWQARVRLTGSGTRVGFYGASMLAGREHGDLSLVVEHAAPHTVSRELFKNVVDGAGHGVFQGRIVVEPDAQKTDGKMMAQTILLSDEGEFDSKPELEIFADDVQCGHGSTTGRIDDNHLFYLLSRGVPRPEAERLLIEAFLADAIDAIGDEAIAGALKGTIGRWLARRGKEAR